MSATLYILFLTGLIDKWIKIINKEFVTFYIIHGFLFQVPRKLLARVPNITLNLER